MNDTWYIEVNGQLYGPYLALQLMQMAQNNQLSLQTFVKSAQNGAYYKVQDIIVASQAPIGGINANINIPSGNLQAPASFTGTPVTPIAVAGASVTPVAPQFNQHGVAAVSPMVQPLSQAPTAQPSFTGQAQVTPVASPAPKVAVNPTNSPVQGVSVTPMPQQQEKTPPLVKPIMVTPLKEQQKSEPERAKQTGITNSMREWIDRSNVENGEIVCPHCWGRCSLETILFISSHPELMGDPLLGGDAATRFLPKYFTAKGTAFDEKGLECTDMACPHCHLKIPNAIIDLPSSFFSIVGAPASGKSYFLTSMIWQLRKNLPRYFNYSLFDTDPVFNMVLNNYERILFLNSEQQEYVSLPKTELHGKDFSNQIIIDNNSIDLPRPFVFTLSPQPTHPYYERRGKELERSLVLYDNAGEHFETGRDSIANLATVHLVHSDGIVFLYDPLKDIRLRQGCSADDPQISKNTANITNQITIFTEMVARIHKYGNLKANEKYDKPLIMVIPKYDAWKDSFPLDIKNLDLIVYDSNMSPYLNMDVICAVSFCLRKYLLEIAPEIVGLAEGFSKRVYFIPVSALGRMPEFDDKKSLIGIKPDHLIPIWAEIPFLLQLHLNDLLQAVCLADDTIPCVTKYQFNRGYIMFEIPETDERHTLPSFYCGKTIYCAESKKYYRLPDYPKKNKESETEQNDADQINQDFWAK